MKMERALRLPIRQPQPTKMAVMVNRCGWFFDFEFFHE